jgi:hypothetical protein
MPAHIENPGHLKLLINLPLDYKWIHLHSTLNYEHLDPDPANYSGWYSSHQLWFNTSLVKKVMKADFGIKLDYYNYPFLKQFNPVLQLYYTSSISNDPFYSLGIFMHFHVSDFTFIIDVDHLDSYWIKNRPFLVASYPVYDFFFKFGLNWKFLN